jgi:hypothetical protein
MSYLGNTPGVSSQRLVSAFTATAGQTVFSPSGGYTLGYVDVLLNGIELLSGTDFTAADGVNVVLTVAASAGDEVKVKSWLPRGLSDGYTKAEADARYEPIDSAYTKSETDALLAPKASTGKAIAMAIVFGG